MNTLIDIGLFMALVGSLGILVANFVSTSAGMTFSFVVNGLFTFGAGSLSLRHAALFVSTTGVTLWLVQPLMIHGLLALANGPLGREGDLVVLAVKVLAIGISVVLNFIAYRFVVWPERETPLVEPHVLAEPVETTPTDDQIPLVEPVETPPTDDQIPLVEPVETTPTDDQIPLVEPVETPQPTRTDEN